MKLVTYLSCMRNVLYLLLVVGFSGCEKVDRLLGVKDNPTVTVQYVLVACCMDPMTQTYPTTVPQDHIDLCRRPPMPANNTYYTLQVTDCGEGRGFLGDEYY